MINITRKQSLKDHLILGSKLVIVYRDASQSGMTRYYDVYIIIDNELVRFTNTVAEITGIGYDEKREALKIKGTGFSGSVEILEHINQALDLNIPQNKMQVI